MAKSASRAAAGGRQRKLTNAGDRDAELALDVGREIGNGDEGLEVDGVAFGTIAGVRAVALPERIRRTASREQLRQLARTVQLVRAHRAVLEELDQSVAGMRDLGLSWATISWVVGISADGARKRWGGDSE